MLRSYDDDDVDVVVVVVDDDKARCLLLDYIVLKIRYFWDDPITRLDKEKMVLSKTQERLNLYECWVQICVNLILWLPFKRKA